MHLEERSIAVPCSHDPLEHLVYLGWIPVDHDQQDYKQFLHPNLTSITNPNIASLVTVLTVYQDKTFSIHTNDTIIPLSKWGFPTLLTVEVAECLSSLLKVMKICQGAPRGSQPIHIGRSVTVEARGNTQFVRSKRCPRVMSFLTRNTHCSTCDRALHSLVNHQKTKVSITKYCK